MILLWRIIAVLSLAEFFSKKKERKMKNGVSVCVYVIFLEILSSIQRQQHSISAIHNSYHITIYDIIQHQSVWLCRLKLDSVNIC